MPTTYHALNLINAERIDLHIDTHQGPKFADLVTLTITPNIGPPITTTDLNLIALYVAQLNPDAWETITDGDDPTDEWLELGINISPDTDHARYGDGYTATYLIEPHGNATDELNELRILTEHAASLATNAIETRDRLIRHLHDNGDSLRDIALSASLSPEGVRKILNR
jgi:hypothetical protein